MRITIFILSLLSALLIVDSIFTEKRLNSKVQEIKALNARVDSLKFSIYLDSVGEAAYQNAKKQLEIN